MGALLDIVIAWEDATCYFHGVVMESPGCVARAFFGG